VTPARTIRIVIVDDHDMLRSGLSLFLKTCPDFLLIGEASNGMDAIASCEQLQPDVVLMDLIMPGIDGVTAIRQIREKSPSTHFIALSSFVDESLVNSALKAGAIGYLLKNASIDSLANAIRDAYAGKSTLAPEAAQTLVDAAQRPDIPNYPLSRREREVLTLMVDGLSNVEIAERLVIGVSTAKKHVSNIYVKLGADNRAEAVALAVRHRLVAK
jgi:NarL family two-component system response regulator LiaR